MSPLRERLRQPVNGYGLVVVLVTCISLCVASLLISLAVGRSSLRQFCDIVVSQTDSYRQTPPQTPTGQNVARRMELLRTRLGCTENGD